jgi:hypothetical protein
MLLRRIHDTDGSVSDFVNITDRTVDNSSPSGTVHSGVRFGSSGVLSKIQFNGGFSAISGEWLGSGAASGFFLQRTILSGTLEDDAGTGWLQLNANRDYDNQKSSSGTKITVVFFEVSSDVSGVPVVDTATMTFVSSQGQGPVE